MGDPYRTPGKVDPPRDTWVCPGCQRRLHIAANARMRGNKIVCMDCAERR